MVKKIEGEEKKTTAAAEPVKAAAKKTTAATKTAEKKPVEKKPATAKPAAEKKTTAATAKTAPAKTTTAKKTTAAKTATKPAAKAAEKKPAAGKGTASAVAKVTPAKEKAPAAKKTAAKAAPAKSATRDPNRKIKVLFAASEAQPFSGTGGLGEVAGSLPKALNATGKFDVRVMTPFYKESIPAELASKFRFIACLNVQLSWRTLYCGVYEYDLGGVKYYFLDNEYYFKRHGLYGFYDDGERFAFFSRAVCEVEYLIDFIPDVIHANDWQTALVPVYYKLYYMHLRDGYRNVKTVFTVHNIEYQGKYGRETVEDLFGISRQELYTIEHGGCINLMKAAMDYSDAVTTVSPTYAKELLSPEYAHGLSDIIRKNAWKLTGILNGIDYDSYDPATDPALFAPYSAADPAGKAANKEGLQTMLNLPVNPDIPVIAMITRLVSHKGIDLLKSRIHEILKENVQLVLLGKGDADYEGFFQYIAHEYGNKFRAVLAYNKDLSRKFYAGADIFLMPSKSEPCGLSQMIAARYGTVPVVRETGGLFDSIKDCFDGTQGNGFTFARYDGVDMENALRRALKLYNENRAVFNAMSARIMEDDFSWGGSAKHYTDFYTKLV